MCKEEPKHVTKTVCKDEPKHVTKTVCKDEPKHVTKTVCKTESKTETKCKTVTKDVCSKVRLVRPDPWAVHCYMPRGNRDGDAWTFRSSHPNRGMGTVAWNFTPRTCNLLQSWTLNDKASPRSSFTCSYSRL